MKDSTKRNNDWDFIGRAALIWLVLITGEVVHGILRAVALVPIVGDFRANQIGVFTGCAIILAISYLTIRWIGAARRVNLLLVGALWLALTVLFEFLFGRLFLGLSWKRILSDYNLLQGGLMPVGLVFLFFSPLIAAKLREITKTKRSHQ